MLEDIDLFIFDWSGTLSDDRLPVFEADKLMCEYYGLSPELDFTSWLQNSKRGPQEYFWEKGVQASAEEIWTLYKKCFQQVLLSGVKPTVYEDTAEALRYLSRKGKWLAIISSHPNIYLQKEAQEYGVKEYFNLIKGDVLDKTEGIESVYTQLQVEAEHTAYVGDVVFDIQAAKRAHVRPIALARGYHSQEMLEKEQPFALWLTLQGGLYQDQNTPNKNPA